MLTGEALEFFFDKDELQWGDDWRHKVDEAIAAGALFVPVLTPRYFMSPECRRELGAFARQATNLGVTELVLPIYYVTVPELGHQESTDDLLSLVRTFHWEDWRDLRFSDRSSEQYRRAVARLAERLVAATQQAEQTEPAAPEAIPADDAEEDAEGSPGLIDRLAASEEAMPRLSGTLGEISKDIEVIGGLANDATAEMRKADTQAPGFAARLLISRKFAKQLASPVERIGKAVDTYIAQLHAVDDGLRILIERAPAEAANDESIAKSACELFKNIRFMSSAARTSQGIVQGFISSIAPIEGMARDLRPPLRRLRSSLTKMIEGGQTIDEWVRLIEASELPCPEVESDSGYGSS
jgi:hypothetical protein